VGERSIESAQGLLEDAELLVEPRDLPRESLVRQEHRDLDRTLAIDAIQPSDALLNQDRVSRQIEQHEPAAEMKVTSFAACFSGNQ